MKLVSLVPINSTPDPSMIRISSANLSRSRRWRNAVPLNTDTPNRTFIISPSGLELLDQPVHDRLDHTVASLQIGRQRLPRSEAPGSAVASAHRRLENSGRVCHGEVKSPEG